jgi:hypothetical protein
MRNVGEVHPQLDITPADAQEASRFVGRDGDRTFGQGPAQREELPVVLAVAPVAGARIEV